ncbi:hypothetical protein ACJA88_011484 [Fusarium oxysporum]
MGDVIPQSIPRTSRAWAVPGSTNIALAKFPSATKKPSSSNPQEIATSLVSAFNTALKNKDLTSLARLFSEDGFWRDHLALSWNFRTVQGPSNILSFLKSCSESKDGLRLTKIEVDSSAPVRQPQFLPIDGAGEVQGVQFFFEIETVRGKGLGLARLIEENGEWKIFTFYTRIQELKGFEEAINDHRSRGVEHGGKPGRKNWAQRREAEADFADGSDPAVLIVGAGQAGLTAAARLKMLGVEALAIDQNDRTSLVETKWDDANKRWDVTVERTKEDGTKERRTLHPRHLIQATGHSGKKNMPDMKGISDFKGDRLCHSSEFSGARDNSQGKKAIVVGSCNSGHDIAQDFLEKGYDVTMVQRSSTHVVSSKAITDIGLKGVYSEDGPPVDDADLLIHGLPIPVFKALSVTTCQKQADFDKDILSGLNKAGFKTDAGPDGAGLLLKYFQRGGGYYIDVGASQLIADGKIKVKHGQEIETVLPHGLRFADGSELEADEIVFATGYQNMRTQTRVMFGDAIADKVNDVWGFNDEGEMRTIWQKSGHPGFWYHGGNLAMCRYYSKLLALQIKGLEEGLYGYDDI